ncbi:MAG: MgtC/SapB family protein [Pseudorhodoplanes sp.]|uniref:MgtC/SapB family protein n=1 Tax=Pseudorhodoplanes sp. TaxID=1934341 RepID=UPI003D09B97A
MDIEDLLSHFAVALGIGLLIGIERGWRTREEKPGSRTAGVRTFTIIGLLGGTTGVLAEAAGKPLTLTGGLVIGIAFAAFAVTFTMMCRDENRADDKYSATTAIAGMLTFALSVYAMIGDMRAAGAAAVATVCVLAAREPLHQWLTKIEEREIRSALVLLAMTFIALPIVPDEPIGPFGGVNPREIWLIAIVLAGVSFAGYVAVKVLGSQHGILLAAAAGGLVSSTAVTASNARRAAAGEGTPRLLAAGVALATAVSFSRVIAIVAALKPELLWLIGPALAAAIVVAVGYALVAAYWRRSDAGEAQTVEFKNPFGFWSVLGFAVLLAVIVLLGRALGENLGAAGAIAGALALGVADVDAVTVSMSRLTPQPLSLHEAALAILAAVVSNNVSKTGIGIVAGRGAFALEIAAMAFLCLVAGAAAYWLAALTFPINLN